MESNRAAHEGSLYPARVCDLDAIFAYLDAEAPAVAQPVKEAIVRRITWLAEFPHIAPATDEPEVRVLTLVRYPYKIYYKVSDDAVVILHIRDARREPWEEEE